ncbi:MAG: hypothetical protein INQ03_14190 [Candidatus Heimdallarchaeota archaeon]|nr:hypothetical protein [Candidatus Heimdallarchaeota archaeon]
MDDTELILAEIKNRHIYFMNYFTGKLEKDEILAFYSAIDEHFTLITPSGIEYDHDAIVKMIEESHDTRESMKIWTEEISCKQLVDTYYLAKYFELQENNGKTTKRISSAIFKIVDETAIWVHVHETWIKN